MDNNEFGTMPVEHCNKNTVFILAKQILSFQSSPVLEIWFCGSHHLYYRHFPVARMDSLWVIFSWDEPLRVLASDY